MAVPTSSSNQECSRDGRLFIDAIEKCFVILEAFSSRSPAMNIAQLSTKTGLGRSATQRVVYTLSQLGYLQRDTETKCLSLSPKSLSLGSRYIAADNLIELARPFLRGLAERFDETVSLSRMDRNDIVVVSSVASTQSISAYVPVGARYPAVGAASGWAIMAFMPDMDAFVSRLRAQRNESDTLFAKDGLSEDLREVRRKGFCLIESPLFIGGISASVPILDVDGYACAALAISCPLARWSFDTVDECMLPDLLRAGRTLSRLNGWLGNGEG